MADHSFVWDLIDAHEIDALKRCCPPDFDWQSLHPKNDTPPLVEAIRGDSRVRKCEAVRWMLSQGADPTTRVPATSLSKMTTWRKEKREATMVSVDLAGHSAISFAIKLRSELKNKMDELGGEECDWSHRISSLTQILEVLTTPLAPERDRQRLSVSTSTIDRWDKMLRDESSHDVTFECQDDVVTAHSAMLSFASPVLAAMLRSTMCEGWTKRVRLSDTTRDSVKVFLELLYTGAVCDDVDLANAIGAFTLAHQWQVDDVHRMLESLLSQMLSDDTFDTIAEAAQLRGQPRLVKACVVHAGSSLVLQRRLKARSFSPAHLAGLRTE